MNRYANGKIYMIESLSAGLVYYGSTCLPLSKRLSSHKSEYNRAKQNLRNSVTSHQILDCPDYKIFLVERYPCNTKEELLSREAYYIRNNECVNKNVPNRSQKEWQDEHKEQKKQQDKERNSKEEIKERKRENEMKYRELNKERLNERRRELYKLKKSLQNITPIVE